MTHTPSASSFLSSLARAHSRSGLSTVGLAVLLATLGPAAQALTLGGISVQSNLGEPLRAEVSLPDIDANEATSLQAKVASPEAYKAAGINYNPLLAALQVTLQRRPDGRLVLRINGDRAINEPFLDLVIEARWASGRLVRDYTLLLDPPSRDRSNPAPQEPATQVPAGTQSGGRPAATTDAAAAPASEPRAAIRRRTPVPTAPVPRSPTEPGRVTVQSGDTASKLVAPLRPAQVSLDQMLIALLRANPEAFVNGNVNRLKAGVVLDLPTEEQAAAIPPGEARQAVQAQSRDFNDYRRKLAGLAPVAEVAGAGRKATGQVQAQVEDKKASAPGNDKLTLSKGAVQGRTAASAAAEDRIAKDRQTQEASTRVAELSRNLNELRQLASAPASPASTPAVAATPASAKASGELGLALTRSLPASATASATPAAANASSQALATSGPTTPAASSASAPTSGASEAASPASAPVAAEAAASAASTPSTPAADGPASAPMAGASTPQPPASAASAPQAQASGLVDLLVNNPLVAPAAGALIALLAALGLYRARQRKQAAAIDSSFLDQGPQLDSLFSASGAHQVDTSEQPADAAVSSMVYSPSQLASADQVDPVAEADVYLAYGRDLQAEEILLEALRNAPTRLAIHSKLLDIYAKRQDTANFEGLARKAHELTSGSGPDWVRIALLGQTIDAVNPLYAMPSLQATAEAEPEPPSRATLDTLPAAAEPVVPAQAPVVPAPITEPAPLASQPAALDALDLDLSFPDEPAAFSPSVTAGLDLPAAPAATLAGAAAAPDFDLDFGDDDLDNRTPPPAATRAPADFAIDALSLDLDPVPAPAPVGAAGTPSYADPLGTKLELAEEFLAIGDQAGARTLAEEVVAEASGELKARADRFLASLP